jgi:single-stranded-DNA-specific exonuclease
VPKTATWTVKAIKADVASRLSEQFNISGVAAACLANRGLTEPEEVRAFLEPKLADLKPPDGMADLEPAADRLAEAIIKGERIAVFGDYDVDGVSSAALITMFLKKLQAHIETELADRFSGYGLGVDVVDRFAGNGCSLIVAVDCGTSDHLAARRAKELGIDIVILDHHKIEGGNPDVYAFVNPERKDCGFCDKTLAAVGIAFYFVAAVRSALCKRGHIRRSDVDLKSWLDLVALGTVADVVPMRGINRIFVFHGLKQMSRAPRDGLKSLIRMARIRSSEIRADHIAYQFAPRLNAAGRLSNAKEAYALLMSKERSDAERLAVRLDQLSQQRRALEESVVNAAKSEIEQKRLTGDKVIIVAGDGWHRGVLGIVAARLAELMGRPAFVIGLEGQSGTGSARCHGELNLHESLAAVSNHLVRFGGHRDAAGFMVNRVEVDLLRKALIDFAESNLADGGDRQGIVCDARLTPNEISASLLKEINLLGPFGPGNDEPIFEVDGLYVLGKRVVGRDHLKLDLKTPSGSIAAFGPRMANLIDEIPSLICVAVNLIADEWRGDGTPELRLVAPPRPGS